MNVVLLVSVCALRACNPDSQKRAADPPGTGVQAAVSYLVWALRTKLKNSKRS